MNISVYRSNKCSYCNLPGHNLRSCQADGAALVRQSRETPEQREKKIEQERLRAEKNRVAEIERQAAIERERQATIESIIESILDVRRRPEEFQTLTDEQKNWTFKQIQRRMKIEIQRNRERVAEFDEIIRIENQRRELYNTTIINFKNEINNLKAIALNLISNESIFNKLNITVKKNEATMDADSLLKPVECGICYQTYENNQFIGLNCNHEFCKQCIITCLRKEKKQRACCAMCRSNINTMMYKGDVF